MLSLTCSASAIGALGFLLLHIPVLILCDKTLCGIVPLIRSLKWSSIKILPQKWQYFSSKPVQRCIFQYSLTKGCPNVPQNRLRHRLGRKSRGKTDTFGVRPSFKASFTCKDYLSLYTYNLYFWMKDHLIIYTRLRINHSACDCYSTLRKLEYMLSEPTTRFWFLCFKIFKYIHIEIFKGSIDILKQMSIEGNSKKLDN